MCCFMQTCVIDYLYIHHFYYVLLSTCLLGENPGPVEAVCGQLCLLHLAVTQSDGVRKTRWALVLADCVAIQDTVLSSLRLIVQTNIQLFELNQRTVSQW